jgi:hypothetical protein
MRDLWRNSGICGEKVKNAGEKQFSPITPRGRVLNPPLTLGGLSVVRFVIWPKMGTESAEVIRAVMPRAGTATTVVIVVSAVKFLRGDHFFEKRVFLGDLSG